MLHRPFKPEWPGVVTNFRPLRRDRQGERQAAPPQLGVRCFPAASVYKRAMRKYLSGCRFVAVRLWASPYSLFGLALGVCLRGRFQIVDGVVEIHGPWVATFLLKLPPRALAVTIGHVVMAHTPVALDLTRTHERVHVGQFERWGPLMGPAYVAASIWAWGRGGDYYRDNPFEIEAFTATQASTSSATSSSS